MKTIAGKITSSAPITISKAASIISKFVAAETGASQAICAYLRRANDAFDELVRVHLKSDRRKHNREKSSQAHTMEVYEEQPSQAELSQELGAVIKMEGKKKKNGVRGDLANFVDNSEANMINEGNLVEVIDRKKHKKKEKDKGRGSIGSFEDNAGEIVRREGESGREIVIKEEGKKKKRKNGEIVEDRMDGSEEQRHKKKKRKREGEGHN